MERLQHLERTLRASSQRFNSLMSHPRDISKYAYTEGGAMMYGRDAQTVAGIVLADKAAIDLWYRIGLLQNRPA